MSEFDAQDYSGLLDCVGASFVELDPGVWVNPLHIVAVGPRRDGLNTPDGAVLDAVNGHTQYVALNVTEVIARLTCKEATP
jgi:hypothetical protein